MITAKRDVCSTSWMSRPLTATAKGAGSAGQDDAGNQSVHRRIWSFWCECTVTMTTQEAPGNTLKYEEGE